MESGALIAIIVISIIVIVLVILLVMWLIAKSKGKIEIVLDNYNYSPGDTISGKINLTIKKPVQSKGLSIRLIGERIQTNRVNIGNQKSSTNSQMVFDFKQPVEGAKEYQPGPVVSYDFKIKIPNDVITKLDGVLGAVVKTAQFLSGTNTSVKWYLLSDLDIPGIDISKKIRINIA